MKISLNWLGQHVAIDDDAGALADSLTMAGLEVESVDTFGGSLDGVVVGKVLEAGRHPNADRLSLCKVEVGESAPLQIVCGAPNVAAGQHVAVARVGTVLTLPDSKNPGKTVKLKIKRSKIRGEYSEGMICAEDELGVGEDHDGILVLSDTAAVGSPVIDVLQKSGMPVGDSVLDIAITPNRPDATSHVGVARDVAALNGVELILPDIEIPESEGAVGKHISIEVDAADGCPSFAAMVVEGVTIGDSPAWMQARLRAVGLRPRNNVVDVTNYVMLELGQPLHAYDLDTLADRRIVVREASDKLRFITLDEKEREVPKGTLMVCDGAREIGIGGVMGGLNTEVTENTTRVLVEGAYWNPAKIRQTSKELALQTDASYRFERGVDTAGQARAVARAAALIADTSGGNIVNGIIEIGARPETRHTTLRLSQIDRHLGQRLDEAEVAGLLKAIGLIISPTDDPDVLRCEIPTFRPDIEREIDVIEEVARLRGYDSFPMPIATRVPNFVPKERPEDEVRTLATRVLVASGYREIYTNSLISEDTARRFHAPNLTGLEGEPVVTANAITSEMTTLRPSLLAGALPVLKYNANRGQQQLRFFEIGNVFAKNANDTESIIPGYSERTSLLLIGSGPRRARSFDDAPPGIDYFDVKGVVELIIAELGMQIHFTDGAPANTLVDFGQIAKNGDHHIGVVGQLTSELSEEFGATGKVCYAELNLTSIISARSRTATRYRPTSRFPVVERDLAVVVSQDVRTGHILDTVEKSGGALLLSTNVFDIYQGKGIPEDKKSVAISLRFGADRTLTDAEVEAEVAAIVSALQKVHAGELRT